MIKPISFKRVRDLYAAEYSTYEIARELGTDKNRILRILIAAGIPRRCRSFRRATI